MLINGRCISIQENNNDISINIESKYFIKTSSKNVHKVKFKYVYSKENGK